jgi:hypothetical protein
MQEILVRRLEEYIRINNPNLMLHLQMEKADVDNVRKKVQHVESLLTELLAADIPLYIIEDSCMDVLTQDLRPSKFNYLLLLLQENFPTHYERFGMSGILPLEVANLAAFCQPLLDTLGFNEENEKDKNSDNTVIQVMQDYLQSN